MPTMLASVACFASQGTVESKLAKRKHEEDEEERLLNNCEEDTSVENTSDTLGKTQDTLSRLEKGISSMTESILSMNKAIEQISTRAGAADTARPDKVRPRPRPKHPSSKRSRSDQTSDIGGEGEESDNSSSLDEDNLLSKQPQQEEKSDLLDEIAMELDIEEDTDTDVSEKLAKIINRRWTEKLNPEKLSEKLKKHSRPGNLTVLIAPKVNPEIWAVMSNMSKREDLRKANVQNSISKVGSILAKCTDQLIKAHNEANTHLKLDELVSLHTDALALLGTAQVELSLQRRDAILNRTLKKEYGGLRSQNNVPITSFLFGDDLQQQLKNIKASNTLTQSVSTSHMSKRRGYNYNNTYRREQDSPYWKHRGRQTQYVKSKNLRFPSYKKKEGGQKN